MGVEALRWVGVTPGGSLGIGGALVVVVVGGGEREVGEVTARVGGGVGARCG